jgi:hypothetical protein
MNTGLAVLLAAVDQAFRPDLYHAGPIQLLERLQAGQAA